MVHIAVDAMGGDYAPGVIVQGALRAHAELGLNITLVGDQNLICKELGDAGSKDDGIRIHHCSQMVAMDEASVKVLRHKKDASIMVAFDLAKKGKVDAVVSAGNSGDPFTDTTTGQSLDVICNSNFSGFVISAGTKKMKPNEAATAIPVKIRPKKMPPPRSMIGPPPRNGYDSGSRGFLVRLTGSGASSI